MALEIYIFRHGVESELPDPPGLSAQGAARVRRQARGLSWLNTRFDVMYAASDAVSRDTAAVLAESQTPTPAITELPALGPDGHVEIVLQEVSNMPADARIAMVGCEPVVGLLGARLIGARHPLVFKKAAACRIDLEPGNPCGRLRWFLPPKILREMGRWA